MTSVNLSDYYSKISDIRQRILSKHQTAPADKSIVEFQITKESGMSGISDFKIRGPLESINSNKNAVDERVRELDSVNQKIKSILATKRPTAFSSNYTQQTPKTEEGQHIIKRVVSLFQNENDIVESHVTTQVGLIQPRTFKLNPPQKINYSNKYKTNDLASESRFYKETYQETANFRPTLAPQETREQRQKRYKEASNMTLEDYRKKYMIDVPKKQIQPPLQKINVTFETRGMPRVVKQEFKKQLITPKTKQRIQYRNIDEKQEQLIEIRSGKGEVNRLTQLLKAQINLDNRVKEMKEQFQNYKNPDKWNNLKAQLNKKGCSMTHNQLQLWAKINPEEYNPFSEINNIDHFYIQQFATVLIEAKKHWDQTIKESVSIQKLEQQHFRMTEIDLGGKGYITLQDLVCFINLSSDSYLRNRDVFSMFKRWVNQQKSAQNETGGNKIKYETFLNHVTK